MAVRLLFLTAPALAVVGIMASAVVAIDSPGSDRTSTTGQTHAVSVPLTVHGLDEIAEAQPGADPDATGVIAVMDQRTALVGLWSAQGRQVGFDRQVYALQGSSADKAWQAGRYCSFGEDDCRLLVLPLNAGSASSEPPAADLKASFLEGQWAPEAALFAALDREENLYVVGTHATATHVAYGVTAYAWTGADALLFAANGRTGPALWRADVDGAASSLASLASPVDQLFPSPDGGTFAFAQSDPAGWRLMAVDAANGRLTDFGNLGAEEGTVLAEAPAFSIAWSPDEVHLAVGPVTEDYTVHVLEPGGPRRSHSFETGYTGELKWSPDGRQLAVSTYAPDRVWHEVYVLDIEAPDSEPRFLLDGCEIVWSPDGRFVAVKREPLHAVAVAVIQVQTGAYWHLTRGSGLVPVAWGTNEEEVLTFVQLPVPRSVQLSK